MYEYDYVLIIFLIRKQINLLVFPRIQANIGLDLLNSNFVDDWQKFQWITDTIVTNWKHLTT